MADRPVTLRVKSFGDEIPYVLLIYPQMIDGKTAGMTVYLVPHQALQQLFPKLFITQHGQHFTRVKAWYNGIDKGQAYQLWRINYPEGISLSADERRYALSPDFLNEQRYQAWHR